MLPWPSNCMDAGRSHGKISEHENRGKAALIRHFDPSCVADILPSITIQNCRSDRHLSTRRPHHLPMSSAVKCRTLPTVTDNTQPISRHLLRDWWERGRTLAKLPPEPGRGWHSLRRQFATEMKHAPLKDLCALGGWKSPQTVLTCYQRADPVLMQQALSARRRLEA